MKQIKHSTRPNKTKNRQYTAMPSTMCMIVLSITHVNPLKIRTHMILVSFSNIHQKTTYKMQKCNSGIYLITFFKLSATEITAQNNYRNIVCLRYV
jgi:hypothetical protein